MEVQTSTGLTLSVVADTPATEDQAGYEALSYIEVGEVVSVSEYGASQEVVNHQPLKTGITEKYKGFTNYGSVAVEMGRVASDAGQQALADGTSGGANDFSEHSFKFEYPSGDVDYFQGKIFGYTKNPGGANSIVSASTNIEINTKITEVQPT